MTRPRRSALHTILSDGLRPDVVAKQEDRRVIEQHVGRFIITWGHLDMALSMAVAARANPASPGALQQNFFAMATFAKIGFLRNLIPATWADGERLLTLLTDGNKYRNNLAHPLLAQGGYHEGSDHGWHLWKPTKGGATLDLDDDEMLAKERDAVIASVGVIAMTGAPYMNAMKPDDWDALSLGESILQTPGTWATVEAYEKFIVRVEEIFEV